MSGTSTAAQTVAGSPKAAARHSAARRELRQALAKRIAHAQWVSADPKTGVFATHAAIRGTVTAVSSHSITVKAADGVSQSYAITGATKVRVKGTAAGHPSTIGGVKTGDPVGVLGTGTAAMTATFVLVG